jgi:hypothetical protein
LRGGDDDIEAGDVVIELLLLSGLLVLRKRLGVTALARSRADGGELEKPGADGLDLAPERRRRTGAGGPLCRREDL